MQGKLRCTNARLKVRPSLIDMDNEQLEQLMYQQILSILRKEDITAAEAEVCRKYLNDAASRKGVLGGFSSPDNAKTTNWDGIAFDDVRLTVDDG